VKLQLFKFEQAEVAKHNLSSIKRIFYAFSCKLAPDRQAYAIYSDKEVDSIVCSFWRSCGTSVFPVILYCPLYKGE
jgi:hypothetical protein